MSDVTKLLREIENGFTKWLKKTSKEVAVELQPGWGQ